MLTRSGFRVVAAAHPSHPTAAAISVGLAGKARYTAERASDLLACELAEKLAAALLGRNSADEVTVPAAETRSVEPAAACSTLGAPVSPDRS